MRKKWLWVGVALICVTVWYLARGRPQRSPGNGAIVEFVRDGHWLSVFAGPTAKRTDLAALEQLGAFHPGLSPNDTGDLYGQPDRVIGPENGAEYAEYHNRYGRIRLGYEESADGWVSHPLYFFPHDDRPEAFFPRIIVSHMRSQAKEEVVMLFECGFEQPFMHAVINQGHLTEVVWQDGQDLARRPDPSQCTEK